MFNLSVASKNNLILYGVWRKTSYVQEFKDECENRGDFFSE